MTHSLIDMLNGMINEIPEKDCILSHQEIILRCDLRAVAIPQNSPKTGLVISIQIANFQHQSGNKLTVWLLNGTRLDLNAGLWFSIEIIPLTEVQE